MNGRILPPCSFDLWPEGERERRGKAESALSFPSYRRGCYLNELPLASRSSGYISHRPPFVCVVCVRARSPRTSAPVCIVCLAATPAKEALDPSERAISNRSATIAFPLALFPDRTREDSSRSGTPSRNLHLPRDASPAECARDPLFPLLPSSFYVRASPGKESGFTLFP